LKQSVRTCALATLAVWLVAGTASAEVTKEQCIDANAKAQDLRRDHHLAAAREQLQVCGDPACPGIIRADCTQRFVELAAAQPTVLFDVVDIAGALVTGARVTVDGKTLLHTDPGVAVSLDPGEHKAVFEAAGFLPVNRTIVMLEGDKGHHEHVVLTPSAEGRGTAPPPTADDGGVRTQRILGLTAGGVGVVSFVVGAVFGVMTLSEKSDQESACAGPCSATAHAQAESDHSAGITDSTVSTVGILAGLALMGGGAALYFTAHPRAEHGPTPLGFSLRPSFGPGTAGLAALGTF
jgi:hypothetical protein